MKIHFCGFRIDKQLTNKIYFTIMKKQFLKSLALAVMLLCSASMSAAIDWSTVGWVTGSNNKYKVSAETADGMPNEVVSLQQPGWAAYKGIYMTFPSAANLTCATHQCAVQGAGLVLYTAQFTKQETEVTVTYDGGSKTFVVYYADGADVYAWCHATNEQLTKDYGTAYLTWTTAANGDVVITIDGATFRNGGFENNGSWEASWNVITTTTPSSIVSASEYFTGGTLSSDNLTYTLAKKADVSLPKGAIIQFAGHAFSWKIGDQSPYFLNPDMKYSYGVSCAALDEPTNVAITAEGTITFTAVEGADKYIARIYNGTTLVGTEEVTSGATLAFKSYVDATYTVKVVACALGKSDSSESEGVEWTKTADPLPASKFCATPADAITANHGSCSPLFTIQTMDNGNVTIVISAGEGEEGATKFRGNTGMKGTFTLNGSADAFNTYFTKEKTDDYTVTLTLKSTENKPAPGAVISYAGQIEAQSSVNNNDWSDYVLNDYLYGTSCPTAVTGVSLDITSATLPLNKTLKLNATVSPAYATNKAVTWTSSAVSVATVADGVVTPVAVGEATITVTTVDGNFSATCEVTVTAAAATEPAAAPAVPTHEANKVKAIYSATYGADCQFGEWESGTTYVQDTHGKKFVTNEKGYFGLYGFSLNCAAMETFHADVWVADNCSMRFVPITGQAEQGVTKNLVGGQWNSIEIALNEGAWANTTNWTKVYQLKIDNASNLTFWMNNIYFYTTSSVDAEKPIMGNATITQESVSFTSAVLTVTGATDNVGIIRYLVKNGETEVGKLIPTDGKITVTGLSAGTTTTLSVFAMDAADNVSEDHIEVAVTTPDFPAPAAAPNFTNKSVLAIYADGIDLAVAHDFNLNTWGGAKYDLVEKNGQKYILYNAEINWTAWGADNADAEAIVGKEGCKGTKGGVDASTMDYLHVDIYTDASCPSFKLLVNDTELGAQALEGEGWHSLDFPLSGYATPIIREWGLDNVNWLKFLGWNGVKYVGLDNVYFWKNSGGATSLDAAEAAPKVSKTIENGQVVIIRDGVKYNVVGAVIEK